MTRRLRIPFLRDPHECEEVRSRMTDYLDGDLDDTQHRRVQRHVRFCPRCRRVLGNLRTTIDRLAHLDAPQAAQGASDDEIAARITQGWRERRE